MSVETRLSLLSLLNCTDISTSNTTHIPASPASGTRMQTSVLTYTTQEYGESICACSLSGLHLIPSRRVCQAGPNHRPSYKNSFTSIKPISQSSTPWPQWCSQSQTVLKMQLKPLRSSIIPVPRTSYRLAQQSLNLPCPCPVCCPLTSHPSRRRPSAPRYFLNACAARPRR